MGPIKKIDHLMDPQSKDHKHYWTPEGKDRSCIGQRFEINDSHWRNR
jgi:hypothetical protein